ncbi:MAG: hypothetical protein V2I54_07105 [Bacteroidales bacterium]|jgi:hypothetical protein|nr:hypothetical protein [Bacteroidales bacterium]
MKKVFALMIFILLAFSVGTISCSDDDEKNPVDCLQLLTTYSEAHSAYILDPENTDKCITLKNAIEDYLDSDCPALTTQMRSALQEELEALPCY